MSNDQTLRPTALCGQLRIIGEVQFAGQHLFLFASGHCRDPTILSTVPSGENVA